MRNVMIAAVILSAVLLQACAVNVITVQSAVIGIEDNATSLSADIHESNVGNAKHD